MKIITYCYCSNCFQNYTRILFCNNSESKLNKFCKKCEKKTIWTVCNKNDISDIKKTIERV